MIESGPVPRELFPGIVWCEQAEARFVEFAQEYLRKLGDRSETPGFREAAIREARWAVEIDLHHKFTKARVLEAGRCVSPDSKRKLVAEWKRLYGVERTDRLVGMLKNDKLKQTILEKW